MKKKMYSADEVEAIKTNHERQLETKENEHQDQLDQVYFPFYKKRFIV